MQNVNVINDSNSTTFNKPSFYEETDYSSCLLLDSDILKIIPSWFTWKSGEEIQ